MENRLENLESQLAAVVDRLTRVEGRLDELTLTPGQTAPTTEATTSEEAQTMVLNEGSLSNIATNLGRILLIFGGAYLLRALTDMGFLPSATGVVLGAVYSIVWMFMAYRSGAKEAHRPAAVFYGIASTLMAMPLIVEATTRFQLLSGTQGAIALALFCGLAMVVATRRNFRSLAWMVTVAGIPTAAVLFRMSHTATPFAFFLLLLGLASLWVVNLREWKGLHWLGALGADLGVAVLALLATNDRWSIDPATAYGLAVVLLLSYLLSFAIRSHVQRRVVGVFEVVQGVLGIAIAFWATRMTVAVGSHDSTLLGILSLVAGMGAYTLAFTPETRTARGRNFFFYSSLGLVLVVGGSGMVMTPAMAAAAWSLLAVMMAVFSGRFGRVTLSLQCTLLLLAAGFGSGVLGAGLQALTGNAVEAWPSLVIWHLLVAAATVLCLFIPVAQRSDHWGRLAGMPQLVVLGLSVWEVGGLLVAFAAPALAGVPGAQSDMGALAALRTFVLTASAVTLALSSRHRRWPEARWLVYPLLLLVGLKLIFEDFPHGRPLTLFMALALVGGALIVVSRLLRVRRRKEAET